MAMGYATSETRQANGVEATYRARYRILESLTTLVAQGKTNGLLVVGDPGISKSHTVLKTLTNLGFQEDGEYVIYRGHTSPLGLYMTLWQDQKLGSTKRIIIFDDCDSALGKDGLNIVKAVLDSKERRMVSFVSSRLPSGIPTQFEFSGRIIFISNLPLAKLNEAVLDRVMVCEVKLSRKELFDFIKCEVLDNDYLTTTLAQRAYVLRRMIAALHFSPVKPSVRLYRKLLDLWCHDRANFDLHLSSILPKNDDLHLLRNLLNSHDTIGEAGKAYQEITKKSVRSFFLIKARYRDLLD